MSDKINDLDLEQVDGGAAKNPKSWENFAKGTFVNYGNYIVYTVAATAPAAIAAGAVFHLPVLCCGKPDQAVIVPYAVMSLTGCPLSVPLKWNTTLMGEGPW